MRRTKDSRNADKTMIGKLGFILEAARKRIFRYYLTLIYKQLKRFKQLAIILTVDSRHGLMPLNS